jgi:hypothetical protein
MLFPPKLQRGPHGSPIALCLAMGRVNWRLTTIWPSGMSLRQAEGLSGPILQRSASTLRCPTTPPWPWLVDPVVNQFFACVRQASETFPVRDAESGGDKIHPDSPRGPGILGRSQNTSGLCRKRRRGGYAYFAFPSPTSIVSRVRWGAKFAVSTFWPGTRISNAHHTGRNAAFCLGHNLVDQIGQVPRFGENAPSGERIRRSLCHRKPKVTAWTGPNLPFRALLARPESVSPEVYGVARATGSEHSLEPVYQYAPVFLAVGPRCGDPKDYPRSTVRPGCGGRARPRCSRRVRPL